MLREVHAQFFYTLKNIISVDTGGKRFLFQFFFTDRGVTSWIDRDGRT